MKKRLRFLYFFLGMALMLQAVQCKGPCPGCCDARSVFGFKTKTFEMPPKGGSVEVRFQTDSWEISEINWNGKYVEDISPWTGDELIYDGFYLRRIDSLTLQIELEPNPVRKPRQLYLLIKSSSCFAEIYVKQAYK